MRKIQGVGLAVLLLLLMATPVWATSSAPNGTFNDHVVVKMVVNGNVVASPDVPAYIDQGRTMVPIRFITQALGADIGWDQDSKTVTIHAAYTTPNTDQLGTGEWAGKSQLCIAINGTLQLLNGVDAGHWSATKETLLKTFGALTHYPADSPGATWAARYARVLAVNIAAEDLVYGTKTTDPDGQAKLAAAKSAVRLGAAEVLGFERDYAAGPGKGKGPCGYDVPTDQDPWTD